MNSIERKLQFSLSLSILLLMLLLGWLLFVIVQQLTDSFISSRLQHDAESILSSLIIEDDNKAQIKTTFDSGIYNQPLSGHYFIVLINDLPALHSRSLWDSSIDIKPLSAGEEHQWHIGGPANQALLVWSGGYNKQDKNITIAIAEDLSPLRQQLLFYSSGFVGITVVFLGILLMVQRRIVRHSFQTLNTISNELRQLEQGTARQLEKDAPVEVRPLVTEVNRLIALMDQRLQRSRNALGNLAHALKGPLNLITQLCDNETLRQYPDIRNELLQHTKILQQLIGHELKRARLAGSGGSGQYFYPQDELPALEKLLQRLYEQKALQIEHNYPVHSLGDTDRNDMLELLGNLLDNACKWANHKVVYSIQQDPAISITVEDDGPGCDDKQLETLTQRGVRLDESVPGHGLGLAIVKDIVKLYEGEMKFDQSPELGGLRVSIIFHQQTADSFE